MVCEAHAFVVWSLSKFQTCPAAVRSIGRGAHQHEKRDVGQLAPHHARLVQQVEALSASASSAQPIGGTAPPISLPLKQTDVHFALQRICVNG